MDPEAKQALKLLARSSYAIMHLLWEVSATLSRLESERSGKPTELTEYSLAAMGDADHAMEELTRMEPS